MDWTALQNALSGGASGWRA